MNLNTFDAGKAQDLFHYSLAMQGNQNSTFPCETLVQRLDASRSAQRLIDRLDSNHWQMWDEVMPRTDAMRTEKDLCDVGLKIQIKVTFWCNQNNIVPSTGNSVTQYRAGGTMI